MRTTVRLNETLMRSVKGYAARHNLTLTSVIEEALRRMLKEEQRSEATAPVDVVVYTGSGLRVGVDLEDRVRVQELLDEEDAERFRAAADAGG